MKTAENKEKAFIKLGTSRNGPILSRIGLMICDFPEIP